MTPYTLAHSRNEHSVKHLYRLVGVVVHSGQASGGHYYSYCYTGRSWLKFDDTEVCVCVCVYVCVCVLLLCYCSLVSLWEFSLSICSRTLL
jgi:hypothetical protein